MSSVFWLFAISIPMYFAFDYIATQDKRVEVARAKVVHKAKLNKLFPPIKAYIVSAEPAIQNHGIKMMSDEQMEKSKRIYDKFMNTNYENTK